MVFWRGLAMDFAKSVTELTKTGKVNIKANLDIECFLLLLTLIKLN